LFIWWRERKKKNMPGLREALLLRIPEKTSNLVIRRVDPLCVVALSAHDAISLHHPPPCKECCHYEWKTKTPPIMDAIWRLDPLPCLWLLQNPTNWPHLSHDHYFATFDFGKRSNFMVRFIERYCSILLCKLNNIILF
jgi:hypothetical protein